MVPQRVSAVGTEIGVFSINPRCNVCGGGNGGKKQSPRTLTFVWVGRDTNAVVLSADKATFDQSVVTRGMTTTLTPNNSDKFSANTDFRVDHEEVTFHTSCSKPLTLDTR